MQRNVLIIGAGGVAQVVAHKCAQNNALLGDIHIASRTLSKCHAIIESIERKGALQRPGRLQAPCESSSPGPAASSALPCSQP